MSQNFMQSKLPPIYNQKYLDPVRQKLIYITPEETVRQHLISYLIENLQVPKNLIRVEEPLKHYEIKTRTRADIIIDVYDEVQNIFYPVAVIECKAPEVFLDEKSFNQIYNYADKLECKYCWLTNGEENFCYCFDENKNDYVKINELPPYAEMLQGEFSPAPVEEPPPRLKFNELEKFYLDYVDDGSIGENTPKSLAITMVNFFECLLDLNHKFPAKQYKIFELVEDYGNTHHALECVVDNSFEIIGNRIKFFNSGRIAVGKIGSAPVAGLRKLVAQKYPQIIDGEKFYLGTLTHNRLWYLDDMEVMQVIENLISYALIRDDYRELVTKSRL